MTELNLSERLMDENSSSENSSSEYSASRVRNMLQKLFPERRLVLSQFTFFNQCGVAKPSGETFKRGRRCYRLFDILPIATVLALKEEGIPLCNIESVPSLIQQHAELIFQTGAGCRLAGHGPALSLSIPGSFSDARPLESLLAEASDHFLFWSFDVGALSETLSKLASGESIEELSTPLIKNVA